MAHGFPIYTSSYISKGNKVTSWTDIFTSIFNAVLFIIAKVWRPFQYPSTDEWINKNTENVVCVCVCIYIYIYIMFIHIPLQYVVWQRQDNHNKNSKSEKGKVGNTQ